MTGRRDMAKAPLQASGSVWTSAENDVLVADHLAMLGHELAGRDYSKAGHRRALVALIGRSEASVEFKHRNVSAVMASLGLPRIRGYLPAWNAQFEALTEAVERMLDLEILLPGPTIRPVPTATNGTFMPLPPLRPFERTKREDIRRIARKVDFAALDARKRDLGRRGEEFAVGFERARLLGVGRDDLARRVEWVSDVRGDGAGYDIGSFDAVTGAPRLIEVKTTCGDSVTPFHLSRNELGLSRERPGDFRLYRVFDFATRPKVFEMTPPLDGAVRLEPAGWLASFR